MTQMTLPMEGGCRCGKVRIRIDKPPMLTMACHCTGCQKMSASAYSLSVAIPTDGFTVTKGDTVIGGLHGDQSQHHHCDWCKSWVFSRIAFDVGFVNVRPTMLDDAGWYVPFMETYTSEALPWAKTPAKHRYPQFPEMADFGKLLAEFAEQA
ncbi:GFA family protein [Sphingomonas sp. QA11]|uniref:GFA family protein n=1 Tax=Sphingomonas sp. QA11 TaxID=2950605 RepID=UPI00234B2508|nr:GFA family protein [Sphingomonas sp. QA11]WCM27814.1 GFA family protein [Sphingomonas sp. QA11]